MAQSTERQAHVAVRCGRESRGENPSQAAEDGAATGSWRAGGFRNLRNSATRISPRKRVQPAQVSTQGPDDHSPGRDADVAQTDVAVRDGVAQFTRDVDRARERQAGYREEPPRRPAAGASVGRRSGVDRGAVGRGGIRTQHPRRPAYGQMELPPGSRSLDAGWCIQLPRQASMASRSEPRAPPPADSRSKTVPGTTRILGGRVGG